MIYIQRKSAHLSFWALFPHNSQWDSEILLFYWQPSYRIQ